MNIVLNVMNKYILLIIFSYFTSYNFYQWKVILNTSMFENISQEYDQRKST